MIRKLILTTLAVATIGQVSPHVADAATYRVTGTGDSIFHMVAAEGMLQSSDRWIDNEQGRDAYVRGNQNRASTAEMWTTVVANSRRGGWLIVEDNGARATQTEWRTLMRDIVAATPNDRCLLGVLPVYDNPAAPELELDIAAKANIMVQEFLNQPCTEFVRWNQAVNAHPEYVYDGTHPTEAGILYLANEIDRLIGYRDGP